MKKFIIIFSALLFIAISGSLAIYRLVDINNYKSTIVSLVKEKTGYGIDIKGDIRLRILPEIALDINDVSIKSQREGDSEDAILISKLILSLKLIPLFNSNVEIDSLKLVDSRIKFHIFNDGGNNFSGNSAANDNNKKPGATTVRENINVLLTDKLQLNSIKIENAKLVFVDDRKNLTINGDNIFLDTALKPGINHAKLSADIKIAGVTTPVSLEGNYKLEKDFYNLSELAIKIGTIEVHGEAGIDYQSTLPDLKVAFYFQNLDLNPYRDIIDLVSEVQGNSTETHDIPGHKDKEPFVWESKPVNISILRSFNGHFSFKSSNLVYKDINIGTITVNSYLRNGKLTISLREAEVFGGNVHGESVIDSTSSVLKMRHKLNLEEVDFTKIPDTMGAISNLDGKMSGGIVIASRGNSENDLVRNANGSVSLLLNEGKINGINLIDMAKNVSTAFQIGKDLSYATIFNQLSADFDITNGVMRTDNIVFLSELLDFNGTGTISLPELVMNLRLVPKVKRVSDETDLLGGLRVPILITGSVFQPTFRLEVQTLVEDLIKNPKGTEHLVNQLKRDFENIKDNMKDNTDADSNGQVIKNIQNLLEGF